MAPPLLARVTRIETMTAFGADARAETYCNGTFVKLDGAVLVFATLGEEGTRLAYADLVDWRGRDLPIAIRDAFDADRNRIFDHFLLVRRRSDGDCWLYCGRAHLSTWGARPDGLVEAGFSLEEGRLSPEDWQTLSGRKSWEICVKGEARELALDDASGFVAWLADVADNEFIDIFMTLPSGATFVVFVNASRAAIFFMEGMAEPFSLSLRDPDETSDAEEIFFESLGPADVTHARFRTIPRPAGLQAAAMAFRGGLVPRLGADFELGDVRAVWSTW